MQGLLGKAADKVSSLLRRDETAPRPERSRITGAEQLQDLELGEDSDIPDRDEKAGILMGLYETGIQARSGREAKWFRNLYHYVGEQYCEWKPHQRLMQSEARKPKWLIRETWNEIRPTIDTAVALRTRDDPSFIGVAANQEQLDIHASEAATEVIEYLQRELRVRALRTATRRMSDNCGTAAWEPEWDPLDGPLRVVPPSDGAMPDGDGFLSEAGYAMAEPEAIGAHRLNLLSPFEMFCAPEATGDFDCQWQGTIREVAVDWAALRFPDFADEIAPESAEGSQDDGIWYLRQYQEFGRIYGMSGTASEVRDSTSLRKFYFPSSPAWPRGRMYAMCGAVLVWEGDNPIYPESLEEPRSPYRAPIFVFRHRWTGKSFWGEALTDDLVQPQATLNRVVSKSLAIVFSNARPIIATHPGVKITDDPCPIIYTQGGNTPPSQMLHTWPAPPFPPVLMQFINECRAQIKTTAGINDPSRGASPGADTSGAAIQSLQEQDMNRLGPVKRDEDEVEAHAFRYMLHLAKVHWDTPRAITTLGPNMETQYRQLQGADLLGGTDVWVMHDSALPHNRQQAWLLVTQLIQSGYFQMPGPDRQTIARMLRLGNGKTFLTQESAADSRARRVTTRLGRGEPQQYAFYDDAEVMKDRLQNWMRTQEYEQIILQNPQIQANAEQFLSAVLVDLQAQMAPMGGPAQPPQPPGA